MRKRLKGRRAVAIGVCCVLAGGAWAHGGATGVVKERMDSMLAMAGALERLTMLVEQAKPDPAEVREAASAIARNAGNALTEKFPQGSMDPPSQAAPAIWEAWPEFAAIANDLERLAGELGTAAERQPSEKPPLVRSAAPETAEPRAIWDDLDERELLGLKSDRRIADLIARTAPPVEHAPDMAELYRGIVANCAACHAQFRSERR